MPEIKEKQRVLKESKNSNKSPENKGEIKETSKMHNALKDVTVLDETSVGTIGKVSETLSETNDSDLGSGGGKGDDDDKKKKIKRKKIPRKEYLLKNAPAPKIMVKQIKKEIQKEINQLNKKAMRMIISPGSTNYAEMNNTVKKLRSLKSLLKTILKSSVEGIKTMWLKFVHGIQ